MMPCSRVSCINSRLCSKISRSTSSRVRSRGLFALPGRLLGGVSGEVAAASGYAAWFGLTAAAGLPAFAFLPWAWRRLSHLEAEQTAA